VSHMASGLLWVTKNSVPKATVDALYLPGRASFEIWGQMASVSSSDRTGTHYRSVRRPVGHRHLRVDRLQVWPVVPVVRASDVSADGCDARDMRSNGDVDRFGSWRTDGQGAWRFHSKILQSDC
jgi:hypothetical protein